MCSLHFEKAATCVCLSAAVSRIAEASQGSARTSEPVRSEEPSLELRFGGVGRNVSGSEHFVLRVYVLHQRRQALSLF